MRTIWMYLKLFKKLIVQEQRNIYSHYIIKYTYTDLIKLCVQVDKTSVESWKKIIEI